MMSLVARLRKLSAENASPRDCIDEAADEIIKLRGGLEDANIKLAASRRSEQKMRWLLESMQRDAVEFLARTNERRDAVWFAAQMLGHLDVPAQREAMRPADYDDAAEITHILTLAANLLPSVDDSPATQEKIWGLRKYALVKNLSPSAA